MDRTLTDRRLRVVPAAMVALDRARKHGVRIVLATGRTPKELSRRGGFFRHFDAVIVEGGALYGPPSDLRPLVADSDLVDELDVWLEKQRIERRRGSLAISIPRAAGRAMRGFARIRRFNLAPNRDRIDITLAGVDKGRALRRVIRQQFPGLAGRRLAFADGENDLSLFEAAHYRVAVANAVPELKRAANEVLPGYGGRAVARFLGQRLLPSQENA
jgi:hydroxymethylpyrimidine pyrophosphatase-like HAD family hydrolase